MTNKLTTEQEKRFDEMISKSIYQHNESVTVEYRELKLHLVNEIARERARITDKVLDWRRGMHMICRDVDAYEKANVQIEKVINGLNNEHK